MRMTRDDRAVHWEEYRNGSTSSSNLLSDRFASEASVGSTARNTVATVREWGRVARLRMARVVRRLRLVRVVSGMVMMRVRSLRVMLRCRPVWRAMMGLGRD